MSSRCSVSVTPFAEKYYIKKFHKKYKNAWKITREALIKQLENIDILFKKSIAEVIVTSKHIKICKLEFSVAGTKTSKHKSGNRYIVALDTQKNEITILLVYHKNDLGKGSETANWKKMIRNNYVEYREMF